MFEVRKNDVQLCLMSNLVNQVMGSTAITDQCLLV